MVPWIRAQRGAGTSIHQDSELPGWVSGQPAGTVNLALLRAAGWMEWPPEGLSNLSFSVIRSPSYWPRSKIKMVKGYLQLVSSVIKPWFYLYLFVFDMLVKDTEGLPSKSARSCSCCCPACRRTEVQQRKIMHLTKLCSSMKDLSIETGKKVQRKI